MVLLFDHRDGSFRANRAGHADTVLAPVRLFHHRVAVGIKLGGGDIDEPALRPPPAGGMLDLARPPCQNGKLYKVTALSSSSFLRTS